MVVRSPWILPGGILGGLPVGTGTSVPNDPIAYASPFALAAQEHPRLTLDSASLGSTEWAPFEQKPQIEPNQMAWSPSLRSVDVVNALAPTLSATGRSFDNIRSTRSRDNHVAAPSEAADLSGSSVPSSTPAFTPVGYRNPPMPSPWPIPTGRFGTWDDEYRKGMQGLLNFIINQSRARGIRSNDACDVRRDAEKRRCVERRPFMRFDDFFFGCLNRADYRHGVCLKNGYPGGPGEPDEWGPADEETWTNPDR